MANHFHYIIKATEFSDNKFDIIKFIKKCSTVILINADDITVKKNLYLASGKECFVIIFTTYDHIMIEVYSDNDSNISTIKEYAIKELSLGLKGITVTNIEAKYEDDTECQEPNCSKNATKNYNGRLVCDDHHDYYQDKEYNRRNEYWDM